MSMKVGSLDLQNQPMINVPDPSAAQHAATKNYVDGVVRGLDWKQEVVAASTGNVSLATPGTALDGVTLAANDRVLLKDQTAPAENGIYVWTASGSALTRALDADSGPEITGATVTVQRGTVNADRVYRCTADDPVTLGTTALPWVQVGAGSTSYTAGNGLTLTGSTFDVGAGTGITVGADTVGIDTSVVVRKQSFTIGNGSATSIAVTHNLGTLDVQAEFYDLSVTPRKKMLVEYDATDVNTVTAYFGTAPATSMVRAVVQG